MFLLECEIIGYFNFPSYSLGYDILIKDGCVSSLHFLSFVSVGISLYFNTFFLGQGVMEQKDFYIIKFIFDNLSIFLPSLPSLQTPEDLASSNGKHEAVKVLKEYAEVCGSVVMKGYVLSLEYISLALSKNLVSHILLSSNFIDILSVFWLLVITCSILTSSVIWLSLTIILIPAGGTLSPSHRRSAPPSSSERNKINLFFQNFSSLTDDIFQNVL